MRLKLIELVYIVVFFGGKICCTHRNKSILSETIGSKRVVPPNPDDKYCEKTLPEKGRQDYKKKTIKWFEECIINFYGLALDEEQDSAEKKLWESDFAIPTEELHTMHFRRAADLAEDFFKDPEWLLNEEQWKTGDCMDMFHIAAARYLYLTYFLYSVSNTKITQCKTDGEKLILPSDDKVCSYVLKKVYPPCTYEYQVFLVGPNTAEIAANMTEDFEIMFGSSTRKVLGMNIKAFSLEFSIPYDFSEKKPGFLSQIKILDTDKVYVIQDLMSALFKLKKNENDHFKTLVDDTKQNLEFWNGREFSYWFDFYNKSIGESKINNAESRSKSKELFEEMVKSSDSMVKAADKTIIDYLEQVLLATKYVPDAYSSRGMTRYMVGYMERKSHAVQSRFSEMDYWCTLIESWVEFMREYKNHKNEPAKVSLMKAIKYLHVAFKAMVDIRVSQNKATFEDTEPIYDLFTKWYELKDEGADKVPEDEIKKFFDVIKCNAHVENESSMPETCIDKLFEIVRGYHKILTSVELVITTADKDDAEEES